VTCPATLIHSTKWLQCLITFYYFLKFCLYTKLGDSRFNDSRDIIAGVETENGPCDPDHALLRWFVTFRLGLYIIYLCAKLNHSSFSRSRDMVGAHQNLNGSRDLTMPLSGMVCHPELALVTKLRSTYLPNLKSLTPYTTKTWNAIQNVENVIVWGS